MTGQTSPDPTLSRYRAMFDAATDMIMTFDLEGQVTSVNRAATEAYGYSSEEFMALTGSDLLVSDEDEDLARERLAALSEGVQDAVPVLTRSLKKDGTLMWIETRSGFLRDPKGELSELMVIARDVTWRVRDERLLIESEARYRDLIELSRDAILLLDGDFDILYANPAASLMFEYERDELLGMTIADLLHEDEQAMRAQRVREIGHGGDVLPEGREARIVTKTGKVIWVDAAPSVIERHDDQVVIQVAVRDISVRREAELAAREWESRFERIVDEAQEGIFQTTADGRYLLANQALANLYGYTTPDELVGNLQDIGNELYVDPERRTEFVRLMERDSQVTNFESEIVRVDASTTWISENVSAVFGREGELSHYEGTVIDIASRKASEEAMNRELETARRVQQALQPAGAYGKGRLKVAGACVPAREVGGDFYNWVDWDDESVVVTVGDVMGKGIPAAMIQAMVQSRLDAELGVDAHNSGHAGSLDLGQLFTRINSALSPYLEACESFCTALTAHVSQDGRVTLVDAGHGHALVRRSDGTIEKMPLGGLPFGIDAMTTYTVHEFKLRPGDALILHTDGIQDAVDEDEPDAWLTLLDASTQSAAAGLQSGAAPSWADPEALVAQTLQAALESDPDADPPDDITLVVCMIGA